MNWFGFEWSAFLWVFIILNVINVVIQTIKSIATIKCGAWSAASINAIAYGLYTVVVVYMNADGLGLFWKALIIGIANLVGVYVVKIIEIKKRKDKLWKVEATVARTTSSEVQTLLAASHIPHNYIHAGQYTIFNCYCSTKEQSEAVKEILKEFNAKYFASESKTL
jgi:uncharacterized protein YebE (UPF0316 family)